jgi:hypothetical protein
LRSRLMFPLVILACLMIISLPVEASLPQPEHLKLWLRADVGVKTVGDTVVAWEDGSGNEHHAMAEIYLGPRLVTDVQAGKPALYFSNSAFLTIAHDDDLNMGTESTVFVVYYIEKNGRIMQKKSGDIGTQEDAWFVATATGLGVSGMYHKENIFASYSIHLQSNVFSVDQGRIEVYDNGTLVGTVVDTRPQLPNQDDIYIGKRNRPDATEIPMTGYICEIIIYDKALSDTERKLVEQYLGAKYEIDVAGVVTMNGLRSGQPIAVGTEGQVGPLALGLDQVPLGAARVYQSTQPDLFVYTGRAPQTGLFLYKWIGTGPSGEPIFGERERITVEGITDGNGSIIQTADGVIHGVWLTAKQLVFTTYNHARKRFEEQSRVSISTLPGSGSRLGVTANPDGSFDVFIELGPGGWYGSSDRQSASYRPYDGAGIWNGKLVYSMIFAVKVTNPADRYANPQLVVPQSQGALYGYNGLTTVNLGEGHERELIGGTRFGQFLYYGSIEQDSLKASQRRLVTGSNGIALRHPIINASPIAYPNPVTGHSDLIVGGEGALYYYAFTDTFTPQGAPIYREPLAVLETATTLYGGTLPMPHLADWNGDGTLDIIAGNSEGRVLFFANIGSNEDPKFLPGVAIKAGGRDIHIQAGYRGSIQGPQEARWGYTSPTVIDWNDDGLLDILLGDITGGVTVFINRGTPDKPDLDVGQPLYLDGLEFWGMWRCKPGVTKLGNRMAMVMLDSDADFHLYWQVDAYNITDGGKLRLSDGSVIGGNYREAGLKGRLKFNWADWDGDGKQDLIVGTARHGSVPNKQKGLPQAKGTPGSAILFLRNVGTDTAPVFEFPYMLGVNGRALHFGGHEVGVTVGNIGEGGLNLIVGEENGRFIFYKHEDLELVR